jgi:steroid 5-alpha reductase family enzyme
MDLYAKKSPSRAQKFTVTLIELLLILLSGWILFGPGEIMLADIFSWPVALEPPLRRLIVFVFSLITLARMVFTMFGMMKRTMPWSEAFTIPFAFALYYLGFAILVLPAQGPFDGLDLAGIVFFGLGAALNTGSEIQRGRFKALPENRGRLYTGGLFGVSMHINFFGDILWVCGYALVAHNPWGAAIPPLLAAFFAFYNAPMLDAHLAEHYGSQFTAYAARTKRLIPFVW